ncbi:hypothetical protein B9Z55_016384 [Caenorhabditis nigoni]|nr:hypothetical protein B9Z55_016384 [Caenorhabditis nigoni]
MVSTFGFVISFYLLVKFLTRKGRLSGFQKLCLVKTIPNIIVCSSFLLWVIPLSIIQPLEVSRLPNVVVGQVAGADECGYIYDPKFFTWTPEPYQCADFQLNVLLYSVFALAIISNSLNFITAMKLLFSNAFGLGMSQVDNARRRRRRVMMFIQSVVQDCLHMVDLINCTYICLLSSDLWFQFTFLTLSFVLIYALDGLVMLHFHPELQPKFMQPRQTSMVSKPMFTVVSIIN